MAEHQYLDFDLVLETLGDGFGVHVVGSPAGEASGRFTLPFSADRLENFVLKMGGARASVRRLHDPPRQLARDFGQALYDAVFAGEVEDCLRRSVLAAEEQHARLRIRLRLNRAPELLDVPWEYLYSTALGRPLALSTDTPLVRYVEMAAPSAPLHVAPPLHILMAAPSPRDVGSLDTERELALLHEATRDLVREGLVEIHSLEAATPSGLQRHLRRHEVHVLHFMGHGAFTDEGGVLAFEDEDGLANPVSGHDLGVMLHDHDALRMVVLNACEGSRTSISDPFGGVAQSLVRLGIPAVIAMQFEISDTAATRFAHELYLAIADGYPVDAATCEARLALYFDSDTVEWGTPVLYLRAADGRVFDVERPATPLPPPPAGPPPPPPQPAVQQPSSPEPPPSGPSHEEDRGRPRVGRWVAVILAIVAGLVGLLAVLNNGPGGNGPTEERIVTGCTDPTVTLSPTAGPSGTVVTVTGSGFPGAEQLDVRFNTEIVGQVRTERTGTFATDVTVPDSFDVFAPTQLGVTGTTSPTVCFRTAPFQLTE